MTTTSTTRKMVAAYQLADRVRVHREGSAAPVRIRSFHGTDNGGEYVVLSDAVDGGIGQVLSIWTTSGQSPVLTFASVSGASR